MKVTSKPGYIIELDADEADILVRTLNTVAWDSLPDEARSFLSDFDSLVSAESDYMVADHPYEDAKIRST